MTLPPPITNLITAHMLAAGYRVRTSQALTRPSASTPKQ